MPNTARAVMHKGRIELLEPLDLPEGAQVLVTPLLNEDEQFWTTASQAALDKIWSNAEDDTFDELLHA